MPETINAILERVAMPEALARIENERPAFHAPVVDDRRLAYFLVDQGIDPLRLMESLDRALDQAGFRMEYAERSDFYYHGHSVSLAVHLDASPEGLSARFDLAGRPVETSRTWHNIPSGRIVVTFAI